MPVFYCSYLLDLCRSNEDHDPVKNAPAVERGWNVIRNIMPPDHAERKVHNNRECSDTHLSPRGHDRWPSKFSQGLGQTSEDESSLPESANNKTVSVSRWTGQIAGGKPGEQARHAVLQNKWLQPTLWWLRISQGLGQTFELDAGQMGRCQMCSKIWRKSCLTVGLAVGG